jgi:hypothetical protein
MTFEEVKKDYVELMDIGVPYDMTGGFVDSERMETVIRNPTKSNAKKYMIEVIYYGFQWGDYWKTETSGDIHINDNKFINEMYEKYI